MASFGDIIWVLAVVCAVWVIYEVLAKNKGMNSTEKIIWVICALLFSIITAIVYYLIRKRK